MLNVVCLLLEHSHPEADQCTPFTRVLQVQLCDATPHAMLMEGILEYFLADSIWFNLPLLVLYYVTKLGASASPLDNNN